MKQLKSFVKVVTFSLLGLALTTCQKDSFTLQQGLLMGDELMKTAPFPELTLNYPSEVNSGEDFNILFSSTCGKVMVERGYVNGGPILDEAGSVIGYKKVYTGLTCETVGLLWEETIIGGFLPCSGGTITENLNEEGTYVYRAKLNYNAIIKSGCTDCTRFRGNRFECFMINAIARTSGTMNDCDGNTYNWIRIGTQVWMAENLKTTKYNDGTNIPTVIDGNGSGSTNDEWQALTTHGYCWYNNNAAIYKATYGALYNWYAVDAASNGGKNVCPAGWHVPTDAEWTILTTYVGGESVASAKLKSTGTIEVGDGLWHTPNSGATNEFGFTALPGGFRLYYGPFGNIGYGGYWWSSTEGYSTTAWFRAMGYYGIGMGRDNYEKQDGFSVRCLRD